jgi:hypothetical protein
MSSLHPEIPDLPDRPRGHAVTAGQIRRTYPVGRKSFSRACQGDDVVLSITTEDALSQEVRANLLTTLNSTDGNSWTALPFERDGDRTLTCRVVPSHPGLHSFRAEFSLDGGATWLRDNVPDAWILIDPPQVEGLRLYTLIPTVSGTLADWTVDLTRIRDMGFNAIHLLPITTLDTSESPYAAGDLFRIDRGYLAGAAHEDGLSQLAGYVEAAKALNIRLCFDLVVNHIGVDSTMARRAPDWIVPDQDQPDGLRRARYWSDSGWRNWDDLVLINYEHPSEAVRSEIRAYMTDYALFWAKYANDTGGFVRFDNLHSSDPDFAKAVTSALTSRFPNLALLAEYFTDEQTLLRTGPEWGLNLILATPWNFKFVPQLREYLTYLHGDAGHVRYYMPITSHDSGAPAEEFGTPDSTIPRYVAVALMGTGATGIPQGVELGEERRIDFVGRKAKMQYPEKPAFASFIRKVNGVLADNPAFWRGGNCQFVDAGHPSIIAAFRRDVRGQKSGFLVVCNFDTGSPQRVSVDLAAMLGSEGPYPYCDLLTGDAHSFPDARQDLQLPPCSSLVLRFLVPGDSMAPERRSV